MPPFFLNTFSLQTRETQKNFDEKRSPPKINRGIFDRSTLETDIETSEPVNTDAGGCGGVGCALSRSFVSFDKSAIKRDGHNTEYR